jgi:NAD(P)-dependent dehydrogenase (short-subunit alcohol dehydrogenase family)
MGGEERLQQLIDATPAKRAASAEEIGELAAFLCSPRAAFLTGASIPMDGGLHLRS